MRTAEDGIETPVHRGLLLPVRGVGQWQSGKVVQFDSGRMAK